MLMFSMTLTAALLMAIVIVLVAQVVGTDQLTVSKVISVGGVALNENATFTGNGVINEQWTLPLQQSAGTPLPQPGTISVNSSSTAGSILCTNPAPQIAAGARVDVYWQDVSGNQYVQYGCTVGTPTVSGGLTTLPITGGTATGAGSALPPVGTQVTVAVSTSFPFEFVRNPLALFTQCLPTSGNPQDNAACVLSFQTASPADEYTILVAPGNISEWFQGEPPSLLNVAITQVFISHNSQTVPQTVQMTGLTS